MRAVAACCFVFAALIAVAGSLDAPGIGRLGHLAPLGTAAVLVGLGVVLWRMRGRRR